MQIFTENIESSIEHLSDLSSERIILSSILNDNDLAIDLVSELKPSDFTNHSNRQIFNIISEIIGDTYENVDKVNTAIIVTIATNNNLLDDIGGSEYVAMLEKMGSHTDNIEFYVKRLKLISAQKKVLDKTKTIIQNTIRNKYNDSENYISEQEQILAEVLEEETDGGVKRLGDCVDEILEQCKERNGNITGAPTGFSFYDSCVGGLEPGQLTVVGAASKVGKSLWILNVAINLAVEKNIPVVYMDTEMSREEQTTRILSAMTQIPEWEIKSGRLFKDKDKKKLIKIQETVEKIRKAPLYHIFLPEFTPEKIIRLAKKYQYKYGIEAFGQKKFIVLMFDYIKLPDDADLRNANEYTFLGNFTNTLKNKVAGKLSIPVLAGAQLKRSAFNSADLNADHLADSIKILRYANNLLFLRDKTKDEIAEAPDKGNMVLSAKYTRGWNKGYEGDFLLDKEHGVSYIREIGMRNL